MCADNKISKFQDKIKALQDENIELTRQNISIEEKLSAALDGTGLCLWQQHIPSGKLTIFNRDWGHMLGYSEQELSAHVDSWKEKLHPEDRDWVLAAFEDHVSGKTESYQAIYRMIHKDGSVSWVSDRGRIVEYDAESRPVRIMGTHIDITQEKCYELDLAQLAHCDPLTHLLNRKALEQAFYAQQVSQPSIGGALFFIDLDGFKQINDRYGHRLGDLVLMDVAQTLKDKAGDLAQLARFGGDEFVILHTDINKEVLVNLAKSILDHYRRPVYIDSCEVKLGLSIGISLFDCSEPFIAICEHADRAMYRVKQRGKHDYSFWQQNDPLAFELTKLVS
ncbi:sensor domain-containing diguanylate cyclase [Shewanella violacea]|uniref:Sensory box/GGDEF family protein n=1 Tax=Shewanella violacea (strain JCM 10179 / CIP 106290 / LMG 19151 / DSS12) TaxID=637905 RepID=D4ZHY7_SHEVD|nr:sensor domain-containing diguanylate cyclase [Shewanella violacea]BAJ01286.1 sensory box/GGDEF family protein [Shewanella violacea DSS12]